MWTPETAVSLARTLGYSFQSTELLKTALTHSTYGHESARPALNNERLEFLGDAVLQLVVSAELFRRHPTLPEGSLSKLRSLAVNAETLGTLARGIRLQELLLVGKGERAGLESKDTILADGLEALIGAIYLDGGIAAAEVAWKKLLAFHPRDLLDPKHLEDFDAKSKLQEFCLKSWQELPSYEASETQEAGRPAFRVTLSIRGRPLLCTQAPSKRKGELWLARACLQSHLHLTLQGV